MMLDCTGTLYAVVPHLPGAPPLGVLNMPEPAPLPVGGSVLVEMTVGWDADEAAHIEAVTGAHLWQPTGPGWITAAWETPDRLDYETHQDFREGVVAARFHVTGCHHAYEWQENRGNGVPAEGPCCESKWALPNPEDGSPLWHWTGHAEKVDP